jgi:uncharacterized protein (TIGR03435 family)
MRAIIAVGSLALFTCECFGQPVADPTFAVASLKASQRVAGRDARGQIVAGFDRLSGKNVSLKDLIVEAYHLEPYQVSGPGWFDSDEFDLDAKADGPVDKEQLRLMLRALLTGRFHLSVHTESKEVRAYAIVIDKNGPNIHPTKDGGSGKIPAARLQSFHGDMHQFANLLSIQLTIPAASDPGRPSIASGPPVPVLDETGLQGDYEFSVDFRADADSDMYQLWRRVLQDQLGLRLESRKVKTEFLVVDRAERLPIAN